jgi:glycosyltransferase involved in cell wall biosynthesis
MGGVSARGLMHIGFVVPAGLEKHSGGFLYDRMLVDHLRGRGCRVDVLPIEWGSYPGDLLRNFSRMLNGSFDPRSLDVLLEDELSHPTLLAFNRGIHRQAGPPIIAVVHHLRSSEPRQDRINALYRRIEAVFLSEIDGAVCNSHATRASVETLWPEVRPSVVAYPGRGRAHAPVDPETARARALRAGPLRLVFVGNVIPRKGLLTLVEALAALAERDWELEIIGDLSVDPGHARRIRRAIMMNGLESKVSLCGRLDDLSLATRLTNAHAMVVPSTYEGFGIAYLDGMAFGLPSVATTAGGAPELVRQGVNGLLVAPGDTSALVRALMSLMEDRTALARMGVNALETYERHPSWSDSLDLVYGFLTRVKKTTGLLAMAG